MKETTRKLVEAILTDGEALELILETMNDTGVFYVVEDQIFTDRKAASAYSMLKALYDGLSGGPGRSPSVTEAEVDMISFEEIVAKYKKATSAWPPEHQERAIAELQGL